MQSPNESRKLILWNGTKLIRRSLFGLEQYAKYDKFRKLTKKDWRWSPEAAAWGR